MRFKLKNDLKRLCLNAAKFAAVMVLACAFQTVALDAQERPDIGPLGIDLTDSATDELSIGGVRTESPRETLTSFMRLRDELEAVLLTYPTDKTAAKATRIEVLFDRLISLIDLSSVPDTTKHEVGSTTVAALLDIFGRIELPNPEEVPALDDFDDEGFAQYQVPGTPIRITRIDNGPREREFLFNERVTVVAPRILEGIKDEPLTSPLGIRSWSVALPQFTGPMIPNSIVLALPESLLKLWLGTPIWKIVAILLITALAIGLLAVAHNVLLRLEPEDGCRPLIIRLIRPSLLLVTVLLLLPFFEREINPSGTFALLVNNSATLIVSVASAWFVWLIMRLVAEAIILSPRIDDDSLDANLLRLGTGSIGFFGAVALLAMGLQELGLPVVSILAGLGVGGLALALAIRPTLENFIGGFILYLDQPVSVGDYCTIGELGGVVESIGIRSTKLTALDQTLITIPNAQLADLHIVNWSRNDIQISRTIALRYETNPDQVRYVLAKSREMLHAHPKIDGDTVRVRFNDYGDYALLLSLRVFVKTRNWNEYYAVQEDILFRIGEIVKEAGAEFAFPSQTLYLGKDGEPTGPGAEHAIREVERWRSGNQFPFPQFPAAKLDRIGGTLKYPPPGSPDAIFPEAETFNDSENLSAESFEEQQESLQQQEEEKKEG